jgi:stage V sporulation protein G
MIISDVRVRIVKTDKSKIKASASITIDECFVVHDIKVLEGEKGCFVSMPSRKTPDGQYKDVAHPLNTPTREELNRVVLAEYEKAKSQPQE